MTIAHAQHDPSIRLHIWVVALSCFALVGIGLGWAAMAEVSGAVVAHGSLVADSYVKRIQHPTGGVVSDILVHEGEAVEKDALLVKLDDTQTRANLAVYESDLSVLQAKRARLLAEEGEATGIKASRLTVGSGGMTAAERLLLDARRDLRTRQKAQLDEQVLGEGREIEGLHAQSKAHDDQITLIESELKGVRELYNEGYAPLSAVQGLERQAKALEGERGQLEASAAGSTNKIAQYRQQQAQIEAQHLSEVLTDLSDAEGKIAELIEKKAAAEDVLRHVEIKAPQAGVVHELAVHAIGAVITPGEPIMTLVPSNDLLALDVRVPPQDIDQVHVGATARVRFSAFDRRTTPEIAGHVQRISADLEQDQHTGTSYYLVRIALTAEQVRRLGEVKLMPGMPAEVYVSTGRRTVLSYLIKPLADQLSQSFRER